MQSIEETNMDKVEEAGEYDSLVSPVPSVNIRQVIR